jgi:hypothetical protein
MEALGDWASDKMFPCVMSASRQRRGVLDCGSDWRSRMRRVENWRPSFRGVMERVPGPIVERERNSTLRLLGLVV